MATLIANPEGVLQPMNTVQGGWDGSIAYCSKRSCDSCGITADPEDAECFMCGGLVFPAGHRIDGINYPTPGGGCTACIYESAGLRLPASGMPIPDGDPDAVIKARAARDSQPHTSGVSPLYG